MHVVNNTFESDQPLNRSAFGGSALAIAYTSNWTTVQPNDMTIISVNHTGPWYRLTDYSIPADLPPCPEDGCICTWNWVHLAGHGEGDGEEIVSDPHPGCVFGEGHMDKADRGSTMSCTGVKSPAPSGDTLSTRPRLHNCAKTIRAVVWRVPNSPSTSIKLGQSCAPT